MSLAGWRSAGWLGEHKPSREALHAFSATRSTVGSSVTIPSCSEPYPSRVSAPPVSTSGERGDATLGIGFSAKARGPSVGPIAGAIVPAWRCADELITVVMGFLCHLHDHG